jgi:xylulokinase
MFLGIDLGTSEPLTLQRPRPLWSEQHPADWWAALDRALQCLAHEQPAAMAAVQAIGLSGQMHGAVLLDAAGEVLRPAMLWNDGRSQAQCAALEAAVPRLHQMAGNLAMPGFTAPKLLWVREHEPATFVRVRTVLLPKDWLRFKLTGERVSEMSDASGTLWLDVAQRRWSPELLAACGLGVEHMPGLVEGSAVSGHLFPPLAARWGMSRSTSSGLAAGPTAAVAAAPRIPVAGGGGDNAASAVGIGAVQAARGFVSLGTSGVIFLASDRFRPNPTAAVHAFCHALPGAWHQMSVMLSAASALRWAARLLGQSSEQVLLDRVSLLTPQQQAYAPIFLPYLSGERTPHNNAAAQGVLFGLQAEHDAASVGYAVIEGVAFGLRDGWVSMAGDKGSLAAATPAAGSTSTLDPALLATKPAHPLSLVGGGARSALWAQLIASTLGVPLTTHEGGEAGGALGAARLAWLSVGGSLHGVCPAPPVRQRFDLDAKQAERLAPRYARFRRLYPALAGEFAAPG